MDQVEWYYEQASRVADQANDIGVKAQILLHRSFHSIEINPPDYESGRAISNSAIEIASKYNMKDILLVSLNNRAVCEQELGLQEIAITTYLEAYQLALETNNQMWIARVSENVGKLSHRLGNRSQAIQYYRIALDVAQNLDYVELISKIQNLIREENDTAYLAKIILKNMSMYSELVHFILESYL